MSLVSEALRKARQQAGQGAGQKPGSVVPPTLVLPPRAPRRRLSLVAQLLVALGAGAAGAAGVWWIATLQRGGPLGPHPEPTPSSTTGATAQPTAAPPGIDSERPPFPTSGAVHSAGDAAIVAVPTPAASAARLPPPAESQAAAAPEPTPAQRGDTELANSAEARPRERSFLIDADLGYAKLHLDYLVYRPGSPFGRVNGQDVVIGTTVAGFMVEEITVDYVKLADRRNTVILRVR